MPKGICDSCDAPIDASDWWKPHNLCRLCEEDIASPEKNDKEQPMTTTNTTSILDLWNAMRDAGIENTGVYVGVYSNGAMYVTITARSQTLSVDSVNDPHDPLWVNALHILTGHAETWLRGRGWFKFANEQGESWSHKKVNRAMALPDAILAEAGRE